MLYFAGCKSIDEIKVKYRQLAKQHHPDTGGSAEIFAEISNQFDAAIENFVDGDSEFKANSQREEASKYKDIINQLKDYDFIEIEITGWWLWVTMPKEHRQVLKDLRDSIGVYFKWSKNKEKWYYRPDWYRSKNRGNWSMDKIRGKYGSQEIKKETSSKRNLELVSKL